MKKITTPEQNDPLSGTLQEWMVDAPLPPRFQEHVWNRISRLDSEAKSFSWTDLLRLVVKPFESPKVAYSYAALLLAFGIAAGTWTAQVKSSRQDQRLGQLYVQTIDPYHKAVQITR